VEKPKDPAVTAGLTLSPALESTLKTPSNESPLPSLDGHLRIQPRRFGRSALTTRLTDFGKEVIPGLLGEQACAHIFEGYWEDIGTVRAFFEANLALAQPLPPFNFFDPSAPIYTQDRYLRLRS